MLYMLFDIIFDTENFHEQTYYVKDVAEAYGTDALTMLSIDYSNKAEDYRNFPLDGRKFHDCYSLADVMAQEAEIMLYAKDNFGDDDKRMIMKKYEKYIDAYRLNKDLNAGLGFKSSIMDSINFANVALDKQKDKTKRYFRVGFNEWLFCDFSEKIKKENEEKNSKENEKANLE